MPGGAGTDMVNVYRKKYSVPEIPAVRLSPRVTHNRRYVPRPVSRGERRCPRTLPRAPGRVPPVWGYPITTKVWQN